MRSAQVSTPDRRTLRYVEAGAAAARAPGRLFRSEVGGRSGSVRVDAQALTGELAEHLTGLIEAGPAGGEGSIDDDLAFVMPLRASTSRTSPRRR